MKTLEFQWEKLSLRMLGIAAARAYDTRLSIPLLANNGYVVEHNGLRMFDLRQPNIRTPFKFPSHRWTSARELKIVQPAMAQLLRMLIRNEVSHSFVRRNAPGTEFELWFDVSSPANRAAYRFISNETPLTKRMTCGITVNAAAVFTRHMDPQIINNVKAVDTILYYLFKTCINRAQTCKPRPRRVKQRCKK